MSQADHVFIQNCKDILQNGVWDRDPHLSRGFHSKGNRNGKR